MNPRELLRSETIRELANAGPCITIVLTGDEAGDISTELKNAINKVRKELTDRGIEPEQLLAPVETSFRDVRGETKRRGAIAILRSPTVIEVFRAANLTQPLARVDEYFNLRTLLCLANAHKLFYILALSQNRSRMLRCTDSSSEEVPFPKGVTVSLTDFLHIRQPDHVLDNRASAGPSVGAGGAVLFGTSTDAEAKDEYLLHFFVELDKATNTVLKGSSEPLVPVGVEHEIALYRRVNTYKHLVEPGVHGAPDGLEGGEMHRRALELLENQEKSFGTQIPADFDKRVGTGHASTRIPEIIVGAWEGRISHLFFQESAHYTGVFDPVRQRVKHTDDPLDSPVDLIEAAAYQTILHAGDVQMLPGSAMPNGVPVCALCRYPAPQNVATQEQVETTTV
jgi:hypothetical protein